MNRIAFIIGEKFLYWNAIMLALAVLSAICMYWALAVRHREDRFPAMVAVPVAFVLSMVFSRFVHWYCRPQGYAGVLSALTDYSRGSFALIGVFAGCLLTALLLRLFRVSRNLPGMLDQMCLAGAMGISIGRLAALFTTADRGMLLPDWVPFPLASRLLNEVSGETEVRLAVFMFQSFIAGSLFLVLLIGYLRGSKKKTLKDGDTCQLFLLWYCGTQAVLDSPRYDSLYFRSNGFVSIVQIFGLLTVITILVLFTVRLLKAKQWKKIWMTILTLPLLGLAGFMEYYVQRHGGQALFAYSVMSLSMLLVMILITGIRKKAIAPVKTSFDPYDAYNTYRNDRMKPGFTDYQEYEDYREYQVPQMEEPRQQKKPARSSGHYQGKFSAGNHR